MLKSSKSRVRAVAATSIAGVSIVAMSFVGSPSSSAQRYCGPIKDSVQRIWYEDCTVETRPEITVPETTAPETTVTATTVPATTAPATTMPGTPTTMTPTTMTPTTAPGGVVAAGAARPVAHQATYTG